MAIPASWAVLYIASYIKEGKPHSVGVRTNDTTIRFSLGKDTSITFHGLRHAFASLMLSSGVNLKVTSEMLGHSNIAVTGDIYSHVLPGLQEEAVLALSRRLAQGH